MFFIHTSHTNCSVALNTLSCGDGFLQETQLISCILNAYKKKKNEEEKRVIRHCLRAGSHEPLNFVKVEGKKRATGRGVEVFRQKMKFRRHTVCSQMEEWLFKTSRCAWFLLSGVHKIHFCEHR